MIDEIEEFEIPKLKQPKSLGQVFDSVVGAILGPRWVLPRRNRLVYVPKIEGDLDKVLSELGNIHNQALITAKTLQDEFKASLKKSEGLLEAHVLLVEASLEEARQKIEEMDA